MNRSECGLKNIDCNIKKIRKRQKLTQKKLAAMIGIDPKELSMIERGQLEPCLDVLLAIAEILKSEVSEIFSRKSTGPVSKLPRYRDLKNQQFGRLTALQRLVPYKKSSSQLSIWRCKCACGNIVSVREDHLMQGRTRSCGCLRKKK